MKRQITLYHVMAGFTLFLAIFFVVALSWHSVSAVLKPKSVRVFLFGTVFMSAIAYGYWRDIKYREEEDAVPPTTDPAEQAAAAAPTVVTNQTPGGSPANG